MPKPALTPANVATELATIYAMTTINRMAEATAIALDFRSWVSNRFALTTPQSTYLTAMDDDAVKYFGSECGICFKFMLNITLVYPAPPPLSIGKWVEEESKLHYKADDSGAIVATGEIIFTMIYKF